PAGRTHAAPCRREPLAAAAARAGQCRPLPAAGQERAGPLAGGSDDRAAQIPGTAHMSTSEPVNIRVLDREYTVGVAAEERDSLMAAARVRDGKMREVRGANRMAAVDRVAVLAALNFAHGLQQLRDETRQRDTEVARTLAGLQLKLDALLRDAG